MIFSMRWWLAVLFCVVVVTEARAVPLSVDFSATTDVPLQAGFEGFSSATINGPSVTTHSYVADFGVGPGGTVSVTVSGNTHYRDYAAITGGPFVGQSDLLSDSVLRNSNGTMTISLSDLKPGPYEITTFHHGSQFGGGVWDLLLSDATGDDILIADDEVSSSGTSPNDITTLSFGLLSDGSDVEIDITGGTGPNHAQINGFVLTAVAIPEPATIAVWLLLGGLGMIGFICRRKS